jgi:hypothetical protein
LSISAGGVEVARFGTVASAVNYFTFQPGVAGSPGMAIIGTAGASTDIDISVQPKGAGRFYVSGAAASQVKSTTTSTTGRAVDGYASDFSGATYGGYFQSVSTAGYGVMGYASGTTGSNYGGKFQSDSSGGIALYALAGNAATKGLVVQGAASQSGDLAQFRNSSGTVLTVVDSAGNVGIGKAIPDTLLHVNSNIEVVDGAGLTGNVYFSGGWKYSANGYGLAIYGASGKNYFSVFGNNAAGGHGAAATEIKAITIDQSNGNVGIGTTSPSAKLHINGGADTSLIIGDRTTSGSVGLQFLGTGAQHAGVRFDGSSLIVEGAGASQLPSTWYNGALNFIVRNGNVGIGTTSPTNPLTVVSNSATFASVWASNSNASGISVMGYNGSTGAYGEIGVGSYSGIFMNGNVGIGTSSPAYTLDVRGGQVAGAGAFVNTSDARMKKDIQPITYGLDTVMALKPVSFNWKEQKQEWQKRHQIGLIAQDVEKIIPEVVTTEKGNLHMKSLAYGALAPVLIHAMQELKHIVDGETEAVKELKADNDNLRRDFEAYKKAHP